MELELGLGLALPNSNPIKYSYLNDNNINIDTFDDNFSEMKKIDNDDYGSNKVEGKTLSLLIWNGQPNEEEEEDNDDGHQKRRYFEACYDQ